MQFPVLGLVDVLYQQHLDLANGVLDAAISLVGIYFSFALMPAMDAVLGTDLHPKTVVGVLQQKFCLLWADMQLQLLSAMSCLLAGRAQGSLRRHALQNIAVDLGWAALQPTGAVFRCSPRAQHAPPSMPGSVAQPHCLSMSSLAQVSSQSLDSRQSYIACLCCAEPQTVFVSMQMLIVALLLFLEKGAG